jgi:hypothetical protein
VSGGPEEDDVTRPTRIAGAALAAAASLLLSGCWTGQDAQTQQPVVAGQTAEANSSNGYLALRGLALVAETGTNGPALLVGRVSDVGPSNLEDPNVRPSGDRLLGIEVTGGSRPTGAPADVPPGSVLVFSERARTGGESTLVAVRRLDTQPGTFAQLRFSFEKNGIVEATVPVIPRSAYGGIEIPELSAIQPG